MKNRRNIIESELPPQNPLDIWMKDGKFYRSTKKGWTLIEDQMEFTDSKLMYKSTATSGTIGVNKETGKASIYNDVTKEWSPLGGGLTETTWQELKNKRDAGKLTPGSLYRITDYNCTTTQENTRSAGHQFDIVLLALSEDKLAEEGWAMMNESNIYDVTFADGVTKKCYLYKSSLNDGSYDIVDIETKLGVNVGPEEFTVNEENKTITTEDWASDELETSDFTYNYFQNSNLSAWKVWYCLDNDTSRFAWADDSVDEDTPATITSGNVVYVRDTTKDDETKEFPYGWISESFEWRYTRTTTPNVSDVISNSHNDPGRNPPRVQSYTPAHEGTGLPNGRGVIYRLIDEWNNDVPYDFKNIQTKLEEENDYEYTFYLGSIGTEIGIDPHTDISTPIIFQEMTFVSVNNKIGYFINDTVGGEYVLGQFLIPFVHLEGFTAYNAIGSYASQVKLTQCSFNTIGDYAHLSLNNVRYSSFGHNCGLHIETIISNKTDLNYGNGGVELATKDDIGNIETALSNI